MSKMIWIALATLTLLFSAGFYFFGTARPISKRTDVAIRESVFHADVADNALTRMQGLSGREGLAPDEGMLFLFGREGNYGFWMKDMKFPIDIVWIRGHEVAGVTADVEAEPKASIFSLKVYYPPGGVDKALELPAGAAAKSGITAGDQVSFSDFTGR